MQHYSLKPGRIQTLCHLNSLHRCSTSECSTCTCVDGCASKACLRTKWVRVCASKCARVCASKCVRVRADVIADAAPPAANASPLEALRDSSCDAGRRACSECRTQAAATHIECCGLLRSTSPGTHRPLPLQTVYLFGQYASISAIFAASILFSLCLLNYSCFFFDSLTAYH